jgi:HPt (histidine-containing phosphotransfer) domain-containing protein
MKEGEVFDEAEALDRVDGDRELFFELVEMFFCDYDAAREAMSQAIDDGDGEALKRKAHSLKSALGNLGAMQAYAQAFELEQMGKLGSFLPAQEALERFAQAVEQFRRVVFSSSLTKPDAR